jgi:2-polyprenyl-6-methoxyphenol hydroxylase-like FAD-dependent oxidoreductase
MTEYDAIVVGARCAGAPTAMLLAREGHRVLVVDRATFPSDTQSTHLVHAPGVAALRRWGVLDEIIATGCPAIEHYTFDFGPIAITGTQRAADDGGRTSYAPRRTVLDKILVDAAARAGAEVREGYVVDEIVVEDGIVAGVRGRDGEVVRARVVVGADGAGSRVAAAVRPAGYNEKPVLQGGAYTYFSGLPMEGMETVIRPDRGWAAFPTNDGLTLVVLGWPAAELAAFKTDVEENFLRTLDLAPEFAGRVKSATREDRFHVGEVPNFFRMPFGPGWALVGDAGYTKDPITAQGISDAFLDAERTAGALHAVLSGERSFEDAMRAVHAARDAHAMPVYEFTTQLATLEPPPPELQQLLGAVAGNQDAMDAFVSVVAGTMSPVEFFDPEHVGRIMGAAAAHA